MARYITQAPTQRRPEKLQEDEQPRAWGNAPDAPLFTYIEVPEGRGPIDTGLVDLRGWSIMRSPDPIGFDFSKAQ